MKALKKIGFMTLGVGVLALSACGGSGSKYERGKDEDIYADILGKFSSLYDEAKSETNDSKRYVKYARAEAALLDSGIMLPTTTQNGAYTISRVAPRSVPYVLYGIDEDKLKGIVAITGENTFITKEQREELLDAWQAAREGGAAYDPASYLKGKGYSIADKYKTTFQTAPATLDMLNTSEQADTEVLCNCIEGLVEYNNLGELQPLMAASLPEVSEDGKTYTFTIRDDVKWFNSDKQEVRAVTADDFVNGFHHMLDADSGLDYLVDGVVVGAGDYLADGDFSKVGVKAEGNKYSITLEKPESFFTTRLVYSCFMPLNKEFFESKGGVFGKKALADAQAAGTYKYGITSDLSSMLYNGPFIPTKFAEDSEIVLSKNDGYKVSTPTINEISFIFDNGENPQQMYNDVKKGTYAGQGLSEASGSLKWAKDDDFFDTCAYISDTNATTYFSGHNVNRGTFKLSSGAVASHQTDDQKIATHNAMQNKNFRKALQAAFDRATWNAVSRGEDLKETNIRNMYTAPTFVSLSEDVTVTIDDHEVTFKKGTFYGDIVQTYLYEEFGGWADVSDGQDGWYNKEVAQYYYGQFIIDTVAKDGKYDGLTLDVVYYSASTVQVAQAEAFKSGIEKVLPGVTVDLIEATTSNDYYACGYRANTGEELNQDIFYGSGWGPDFADPSSYLETFLSGGYMTKVCGLNNF